MSSTGAVGKPSTFASSIVAAAASGYHLLKIDGYSRTKGVPTGKRITSRPLTMAGHIWHIEYYPNGRTSEVADYISVSLILLDEDTELKAQFDICLVDGAEEKVAAPLAWETVDKFSSRSGWCYATFIKREELEKSKYLRNDSFTIRCDILVVNDYLAEDASFVSVPPCDLSQHLGDLLKTEKGADVVFEVGGESIAAHRCVLAARSSVFGAEFFGSMMEGNSGRVVRVQDMEAEVFRALLFFVYTGSLPAARKEEEDVTCQHLLVAADRYGMERLKLICEEKLCNYINVDTVATILTLAEQHGCVGLKKACFHFLGSSSANLKAVVATDGFQHLNRSCPSLMVELITMFLQRRRLLEPRWVG